MICHEFDTSGVTGANDVGTPRPYRDSREVGPEEEPSMRRRRRFALKLVALALPTAATA
jgi:hypothetical protein